ncbi:unnamed protein product [Adineta ricciae]|uniref:UAS domain-containing protein n=1 Tax=Adineta ricciae TaxID=249248 RepID=A0A814AIL5_ADIRI|nr:unnamed protein product [Adineta ricciae]
MLKNQRRETLVQFQSRTAIFNTDECIKILEQFRWNCLEAINYVLDNFDSTQRKSPVSIDQPLIPNECLNELEGIRHFERVFQERHANVSRWPIWFKSTLENAINQSHGPFAIFLNHDKSSFTTIFSRQILCSSSVLNVFIKYKCILWPWDVTYSLNKQRLLERSGSARQILLECLSHFTYVDSYPLLIILTRQYNRVVLLDVINGNWDLDQTRACLERTLNPIHEQSIITVNETTSLSPGWIGGRTVGNIRRRPSFLTAFRLSRSLRAVQRPQHISHYDLKYDTPEIIVSNREAKQWLQTKTNDRLKHQAKDSLSSKSTLSPVPSLSISEIDRSPYIYMSPRRAGWAPTVNR